MLVKRLICWIKGHEYKVEKVFSEDTRKLVCERCQRRFAMHDRMQVVLPWDSEFEEFYEFYEPLYKEANQ